MFGTNNKIFPLTNLNRYLYNGKREIKVNVYNSAEKEKKTELNIDSFLCYTVRRLLDV
jgi:hypothetical protein